MNTNLKFAHPLEIYLTHLREINGVTLTIREIDVLACLLNGRNRGGTASLLSITPKTVAAHIFNLTQKFGCNFDNIMKLLSKPDCFHPLQEYYLALLTNTFFKESLSKIAKLIDKGDDSLGCRLVYWDKKTPFLEIAKDDLAKVGLTLSFEKREIFHSFDQLIQEVYHNTYLIYFLPDTFVKISRDQLILPKSDDHCDKKSLFFPLAEDLLALPESLIQFNCINPSSWKSYYISIFSLLKIFLPKIDLDPIIIQFEKDAFTTQIPHTYQPLPSGSEASLTTTVIKETWKRSSLRGFYSAHKLRFTLPVIVSALGLLVFWVLHTPAQPKNEGPTQQHMNNPVLLQANLEIPPKDIYLERSNLMKMIHEGFKKQDQGIKTVALIGIGGAGKTTLARQYARSQKSSIVWEINSETNAGLLNSFETLGCALCRTDEERQTMRSLKGIQNFIEKEDKTIQFVRYQLKKQASWVLIFDNVEKIRSIQKYLPTEVTDWGEGSVIITTQDNHIQNSGYIRDIVWITELSAEEKLSLFTNIMNHRDRKNPRIQQPELLKAFLDKLPSFPLDISIAAYYMKATEIAPEKYLQYMARYSTDFSEIQKNILEESTGYKKTRYHIISLPLEKLTIVDKNFGDLLLLISFLNSKNIPRFLLDQYKGKLVVDNLVYHLKRYSLITKDKSEGTSFKPSFSVHRSTQEVGQIYLANKLKIREDRKTQSLMGAVLENCIEDGIDKEDYFSVSLLLGHTESILGHDNLFTPQIKQLLLCQVGGIYHYLGNYKQAQKVLEENLEQLTNAKEKDYLRIAKCLMYLGNTFRSLKIYDRSLELLEKSLLISKTHHPQNHKLNVRVSTHLGNIYKKTGHYEKAKYLLEESLSLYQKYLPDDYSGIARVSAYLGNVYKELGLFKRAESSFNYALTIYESKLPENYVGIGWILALLGKMYRDKGESEKAMEYLYKSLDMYKKYLPENHIRISWVFEQLGYLYKHLENHEKARDCFKIVLINYKKYYGDDNPVTLKVSKHLGELNGRESKRSRGRH